MPDLVGFLTARYDEAATHARRAAAVAKGGNWTYADGFLGSEGVRSFAQVGVPFGGHSIAEHIAGHSPARVLADLAAKQRLVDPNTWAGGPETEDAYRDMLRILAQPYAEHSDYDDAWRIDA